MTAPLSPQSSYEQIVRMARHGSGPDRFQAIYLLGEQKQIMAFDLLVGLLTDEKVKTMAAHALGLLGDIRAADVLLSLVDDTDYTFRVTCRQALARIGDFRGVDPCLEFMLDESTPADIRDECGLALLKIDKQLMEFRLQEILLRNEPGYSKRQTVKALAMFGSLESTEVLLDASRDSNPLVRRAALESMVVIGRSRFADRYVEALSDPDVEVRSAAITSMRFLKDSDRLSELLPRLRDPDASIRLKTVRTLRDLSYEPAKDALYQTLGDSNQEVHEEAMEALKSIFGREEAQALIARWVSSKHKR